jgi:hypothetical protein
VSISRDSPSRSESPTWFHEHVAGAGDLAWSEIHQFLWYEQRRWRAKPQYAGGAMSKEPGMTLDGRNPEGLATFDPMRNARYRATVRAISDRSRKLKGKTPAPDFERVWEEGTVIPEDNATEDDAFSVERETTANAAIAGAEALKRVVVPDVRLALDAWVRGKIDDDRLVKALVMFGSPRKE